MLLATVLLATILPMHGSLAPFAGIIVNVAVALLFFLHGVRLPRKEVIRALTNWRLHAAIFAFCFAIMPLAGWAIYTLLGQYLPPLLALGIIYLGILPSTVQSATTASSMAGGNVAASVVAAALLNLAGMLLSPLLFALLAGEAGGFIISTDIVGRILLMLMVPFIIGQAAQPWLRNWEMRYRALTVQLDRTAIATAVYVALSGAVTAGLWNALTNAHIIILLIADALLLAFSFTGAWALGKMMRFSKADAISVLFAAAQKSIAVGAPLAAILFPPEKAGAVLLPVIIFHVAQLIISAWLAASILSRS